VNRLSGGAFYLIRFTNRKQDTSAFEHIFDRVCRYSVSTQNLIQSALGKIATVLPLWAALGANTDSGFAPSTVKWD